MIIRTDALTGYFETIIGLYLQGAGVLTIRRSSDESNTYLFEDECEASGAM